MSDEARELKVTAAVREDDDGIAMTIELKNDRSIVLNYPKPRGRNGGSPPWVTLFTGDHDHGFDWTETPLEEFEDWAKIAIGAMQSERERRWLCQICGERQGFGPMLPDEVWNAIAPNPRGLTCEEYWR